MEGLEEGGAVEGASAISVNMASELLTRRCKVGRAGHAAWARAAEASSTQGVPTAQAPSQAPASELHCRLSSAATPPALAASYGCAAWVLEGVSRTKFGERLVYLHQLGGGQARYQRVVLA